MLLIAGGILYVNNISRNVMLLISVGILYVTDSRRNIVCY